MGRRSLHTAEELRELILDASTSLIKEQGLEGLSAREIARRIDYSPGTLYNSFDNLDDLVLTIEGRLLDGLLAVLDDVPSGVAPAERIRLLAKRYLQFASDNPKLWNLLFEHHVPNSFPIPDWYRQKLGAVMGKVEDVLSPVVGDMKGPELERSARVLWASVHGLSSLAAADKLSIIATEDAGALMDDLVTTYLRGLSPEVRFN